MTEAEQAEVNKLKLEVEHYKKMHETSVSVVQDYTKIVEEVARRADANTQLFIIDELTRVAKRIVK